MSPIRRYLRITKYSVLEVRIYLEKPQDAAWLLSSRDRVLPRIIEEVRPQVLPKLREENENARKKGGKKKKKGGIKDVASQEDFEVTIFLTELSSRHSLLTKQKQFTDKARLKSTGTKLTGWLNNSENPINVEDAEPPPPEIRQKIDDAEPGSQGKRKAINVDEDEDGDALFVSSDDEVTFATQRARAPKRQKRTLHNSAALPDDDIEVEMANIGDDDDKKKLAMRTSYDGFSIYGRILCLVVKRTGPRAQLGSAGVGGSQMMEQWVSTQAAQEAGLDEDDDG